MTFFKRRKAFTLIELMIVVSILGILASIAVPSFLKYLKRSKTGEAMMNLRRIFDGSTVYFAAEYSDADGALISRQFPTVDSTFNGGGHVHPDLGSDPPTDGKFVGTQWDLNSIGTDLWNAVHFQVSDPHYYAYQFNGTNNANVNLSQFTATAFGDLDGDGTLSTFVRFGSVVQLEVAGSGGVYIANEIE
ncbi:MAG: prepilin-type N-terminal cleavage/methylation domain-containing protein [Flavobacteriales bacterium]|jgi:prepilin-type N-terminal cleavage/methylation domain-containing protein